MHKQDIARLVAPAYFTLSVARVGWLPQDRLSGLLKFFCFAAEIETKAFVLARQRAGSACEALAQNRGKVPERVRRQLLEAVRVIDRGLGKVPREELVRAEECSRGKVLEALK